MLPDRPRLETCPRLETRPRSSIPAWLVAGVLVIPPFLAGCGRNEGITGSGPIERPASADIGSAAARLRSGLDTRRHLEDAILDSDLVIRLRSDADYSELFADLAVMAVDVLDDGRTWRVITLPGHPSSEVITQASSDDRVETIERNIAITLPESSQSSMAFSEGSATVGDFWDQGLSGRLGLRLAQSISTGYGVKVAILDTGVNASHPIFAGRVLPDGYDFVDYDGSPTDLPDGIDNDNDGLMDEAAGHGCHVAGLVTFVAPGASILPVRVLNSDGVGSAYSVARGIEYAVNRGARVINLSLSMSMSSTAVSNAIAYAVSKGVVLVCAAGNTDAGGSISPLNYPANDGRVWAVGALSAEGTPSSFSAPGPGVVFSAPGERLLSAYWNGGYATWSGTSMASPIVAGTVALYLSLNRWQTPDQVRAKLVANAQPVTGDYALVGAGQIHPGFVMSYLAAGGSVAGGSTELRRQERH